MSFFSDLKRKYLGSRAFAGILWGRNSTTYARWDKRQIIEQGYNRNPVFSAICDRISDLIADLPVYIEYMNKDGRAGQATRHPLFDAMERSDNGYQAFVKRVALNLMVTGESYIQKLTIETAPGKKRIVGFVVLPSQFCNPIQGDPMRPVIGYEYIENGRVVFAVDEVIYISNPSLTDYFHGNSPGVSLAETMDMQNAAITWNKNISVGGGMPSLIIKAPGITPEDSQKLKDDWVTINGGAGNAHKPVVTGGGEDMQILNMNFKPNEAEWGKGIEMATRLIAMRMGYPSELLNDPSGKTYANVTEATKTLYRDVVIPNANRIFSALNRACSASYDDRPKIIIDKDKIDAMGEDRKLVMERLAMAVREGIIDANEAREELGYSPREDKQASELTDKPNPTLESVGNNQQI
jgi:HK97 family phage portal protein